MTTRFIHLRGVALLLAHECQTLAGIACGFDNTPQNGGATVAYAFGDDAQQGGIVIQFARCSNKDRYCKRIGRATAMLSPESFWIPLPSGFDPSPRNIYNVVLSWARSVIPAIKRGK